MHKLLTAVILFHVVFGQNFFSTIKVPVGGLFEGTNEDDEEFAFRVAIDTVNKHNQLPYYVIEPFIGNIEPEDVIDTVQGKVVDVNWDRPFPTLEMACSLLGNGVVSIFTTLWENSANAIESLCDLKEIPVIRTSPDRAPKRECCSINLFPFELMLGKAFADLIKFQNWESFTVLYESEYSFLNIAEIFKVYNTTGNSIILQQLYVDENGNYLDILKEIRKSKQTRFVLHCEDENLHIILRQAQQVGLMMKRYSYIIVSLDMETIDLKQYQHSETNFTSLRLVDQLNPKVQNIIKAMQAKRIEMGMEVPNSSNGNTSLTSQAALIVDAVSLFAETLKEVGSFNVRSLSCDASDNWEHGSTFFNYMKMKTLDGLTGPIQFNHRGIRAEFSLDVIELNEWGVTKIGTWDPNSRLKISKVDTVNPNNDPSSLKGKHLNVMLAWIEPYVFYKESTTQLTGNDQFEGFVVDIIHEISHLEGFTYTFLRNIDDKNGDYNATTNSWNGMIGDVRNGLGDIAIGAIAITKEREEVVDFTTPFMSLGIQMLYLRPAKAEPVFLSFAHPFEPEVWLSIGISYLVVSIGLFLMARVCRKEWDIWNPCIINPDHVTNQFNLRNSFWFVIGSFMQQGAEIAPRAVSTRVLSSFFAFFILVIVSFYKAQLAASLTTETLTLPFNNVEELVTRADKLGISYGAVTNEATHRFFQLSQDKIYKQIGDYMDAHPEHMVEESYLADERIKKGNYAFFEESYTIKYVVNVICDFTSIGDRIHERYYAIALRKDLPYRNRLSEAILHLQEEGIIDDLIRKWWEESLGAKLCKEPPPDPVAPPLNLQHVSGIFWITIIGVFFAFGLAFVESAVFVFLKCKGDRRDFVNEFKKELRFAFAFNKTIKPLKDGKIDTTPTQSNASLNIDSD